VQLGEIAHIGVCLAASVALGVAAATDVRARRIPNWTVLALVGLFTVLMITMGGQGVLSSLAAAAIALTITVGLYAFKVVGAGDSKLFAAMSLFAGLGYLPLLAVATALTGGVIAAVTLARRPTRAMVMFAMRGNGDWGRGIPYGVAIAVGGVLILWAPMTGLVEPIGGRPKVTANQIKQELVAPKPHAQSR
jgi:prepilin peptidase CpaA